MGRILKKAHLVVTNSKSTSLDLEHYYPVTKGKNTPILLGKEDLYRPTQNADIIMSLGISKPYFLSVGTIEPRKNLICLLVAFEKFIDENGPSYDLVIAGGKGWKTDNFERDLSQHPYKENIILLGFVKKEILPVLYTHAVAFIYPSMYEGFGFPVLEAMACGAPVICSNSSSLPKVGGELAHYFNPESAGELKDLMEKASQYGKSKRLDLKQKSLEHASNFSWEKYANTFIDLIENLK